MLIIHNTKKEWREEVVRTTDGTLPQKKAKREREGEGARDRETT